MAGTSLGRLTSDSTSTFEEVDRIRKLLARASDPRLHPIEAVVARTIAYRLISSGLQRGVADFGDFLDLLPPENRSINAAPTPTKRLGGMRHEGRVALPDNDHRQLVPSRMHYQSGKPKHARGQGAPKSLFRLFMKTVFIACCLFTLMATFLLTLMATFLLMLMATLAL
jgi:hypothetical protein